MTVRSRTSRPGRTGERRREMRQDKRDKAMAAYNGHHGASTVGHIETNINTVWPGASKELTGRRYGHVMSIANKSYHDGRDNAGAEINSGLLVADGISLPVALLTRLTVKNPQVVSYHRAQLDNWTYSRPHYVQDGDGWRSVMTDEARRMMEAGEPVHYRETDYHTVVYLDGAEIARYPYML